MALLPLSFRAFMFQSGIDRIAEAFRASIATMERSENDAREARDDYWDSGADDREYDEDGVLIRSTAHFLDYRALEATLSVSVVREAFVTSAFHYWEHFARATTGLTESKHRFPQIERELAKNFSVSPKLSTVNRLNNVLKHNAERLVVDLAMDWSEIFTRPPYWTTTDRTMIWTIGLNNDHVEAVFETIRDSGPRLQH